MAQSYWSALVQKNLDMPQLEYHLSSFPRHHTVFLHPKRADLGLDHVQSVYCHLIGQVITLLLVKGLQWSFLAVHFNF